MTAPELEEQLAKYTAARKLTVDSRLGAGTQGTVFACNLLSHSGRLANQVAVKFHNRKSAYDREFGVYLRLRDQDITHVGIHRVPVLIEYDDELLAIEMTIVSPPFCLDFGGAYLDRPPDYSPEVWADWRVMKADAFGGNWRAVESLLAEFASIGIHVADVNPGNIRF